MSPTLSLWDCAVRGVPASVGTKSPKKRQDWKQRVAAAASSTWPSGTPPLEHAVRLTMVVFDVEQLGDVDNKIKYTCDGLIGVVVADDRLIWQISAARVSLREPLQLDDPSPVLAGALDTYAPAEEPFVYLRIDPLRTLEELLKP